MQQTKDGSSDSDSPLLGIGLLILATVLFAAQDVVTKQLTSKIEVAQIVVVRFTAFALFVLAYAHQQVGVRKAFKSAFPKMQIFRSLLIITEIGLFAYTVQFLGIAEMHAIFSCFPLIVTALSVPVLGEQVGWRRWVAVVIGFIGTLIIVQPGAGVFNPVALLVLLCAAMYALYNTLTRKVARQDSLVTSLLYFGVVGFIASLFAVIGRWQSPDNQTVLLLGVICVFSIASHMLLMKALELASTVILQPFNYFILVWAIIFGYVFFGEVLEMHEVIGAVIVVGSGLYVGLRQYILSRA